MKNTAHIGALEVMMSQFYVLVVLAEFPTRQLVHTIVVVARPNTLWPREHPNHLTAASERPIAASNHFTVPPNCPRAEPARPTCYQKQKHRPLTWIMSVIFSQLLDQCFQWTGQRRHLASTTGAAQRTARRRRRRHPASTTTIAAASLRSAAARAGASGRLDL